MTREGAVKGLLEVADWHYDKYEQTHEEDYLNDGDFLTAVANMLKAQEPVEPIPGLWDRDIQLYKCGACGEEIGAGGIAKYCFHCGRAVKWG